MILTFTFLDWFKMEESWLLRHLILCILSHNIRTSLPELPMFSFSNTSQRKVSFQLFPSFSDWIEAAALRPNHRESYWPLYKRVGDLGEFRAAMVLGIITRDRFVIKSCSPVLSCRKNMDKSKFSLTVSILFPTWQTRRRELRLGLEPKAPRQSPCGLHATKRFLRSPKRFEKTA